jgi:hypothetical protein
MTVISSLCVEAAAGIELPSRHRRTMMNKGLAIIVGAGVGAGLSSHRCAEYARRAGIEGTISRETRSTPLQRTRYIGLPQVRLGHLLTVVGLNVLRLGEWFLETSRAMTHLAVRPADGG